MVRTRLTAVVGSGPTTSRRSPGYPESGLPASSRRSPPSKAARPALTLVRRVDQHPDPDPDEGPSSGCLGGHSPAGPVTLAFCVGFLLALIGVIVYMEVYVWADE
ncbi:uncharacterized protein LOC122394403 [Amphibalanus amphitrite]|uniref:uncharacterized protein LOC122394403 n=1 Tax=Amphibalanus amphitrite TaxID=1232801 RepID=UPI001C9122E9|nr:uncharacterized protein LOC122394403 [Amphibalanus amphitrite]